MRFALDATAYSAAWLTVRVSRENKKALSKSYKTFHSRSPNGGASRAGGAGGAAGAAPGWRVDGPAGRREGGASIPGSAGRIVLQAGLTSGNTDSFTGLSGIPPQTRGPLSIEPSINTSCNSCGGYWSAEMSC